MTVAVHADHAAGRFCAVLGAGRGSDRRDAPLVRADIRSDDGATEGSFDAGPGLARLTDTQLVALAGHSWRNCFEADAVARACEDQDSVAATLWHVRSYDPADPNRPGFEVELDPEDTWAWVAAQRPALLGRITSASA